MTPSIPTPDLCKNLAFWFFFTLWVRGALTFMFFADRPVVGTFVGAVFSLCFALLLIILELMGRFHYGSIHWPFVTKLLGVYVLWAAVSLLWSRADSMVSAVGYWGVLALDLIVVFLILHRGNVPSYGLAAVKGIILGGLVLSIAAFMAGSTSDDRLGTDVFLHPNYLGNQLAIAALLCMFFAFRPVVRLSKKVPWVAAFSVLFVTLTLSLSKTSIAAFLVAFFFYLLKARGNLSSRIIMLVLIVTLMVPSYGGFTLYMEEYLTQGQGEYAATLTGRTFIWIDAWEFIREEPFWGYGFMSFRDHAPQWADVRLDHAHNEWLQQWFSLGIVGAFLALSIYLSCYQSFRRAVRQDLLTHEANLGLALLVYVLVRGLVEASATELVFPLTLVMLISTWLANKSQPTRQGSFQVSRA